MVCLHQWFRQEGGTEYFHYSVWFDFRGWVHVPFVVFGSCIMVGFVDEKLLLVPPAFVNCLLQLFLWYMSFELWCDDVGTLIGFSYFYVAFVSFWKNIIIILFPVKLNTDCDQALSTCYGKKKRWSQKRKGWERHEKVGASARERWGNRWQSKMSGESGGA